MTMKKEEIGLTRYDADASTEAGGDDSPQSNGPHGWAHAQCLPAAAADPMIQEHRVADARPEG